MLREGHTQKKAAAWPPRATRLSPRTRVVKPQQQQSQEWGGTNADHQPHNTNSLAHISILSSLNSKPPFELAARSGGLSEPSCALLERDPAAPAWRNRYHNSHCRDGCCSKQVGAQDQQFGNSLLLHPPPAGDQLHPASTLQLHSHSKAALLVLYLLAQLHTTGGCMQQHARSLLGLTGLGGLGNSSSSGGSNATGSSSSGSSGLLVSQEHGRSISTTRGIYMGRCAM